MSPPASAPRRSRWRTVAVLAVVAGFSWPPWPRAEWRHFLKWRLEPGLFAVATALLALSCGFDRLPVGPGPAPGRRDPAGRRGRIWFLSNLARYVPGNVWSYVGAVELARREG